MDEGNPDHPSRPAQAQPTMQTAADGLPALGIVAAILGIIKAMGAIDQSPEILGGLIRCRTGRVVPRHSSWPMRWQDPWR